MDDIRFNRPGLEGSELAYIEQAVLGGHTSMGGPFTSKVREILCHASQSEDCLLTTSCTDALEMSAMLLDITPGDTVIVPSFTFVSSALAFVRAGAKIVFCDIEPETLGLDPTHLSDLLDENVRAVVVVHYAGVGADMDGITKAMEPFPQAVLIEDNAHGLFGAYRGRPLGSFGRFATLSFHETKNFICGEGGALLLNDRSDIERAHVLLDKGTNRRAFMLGTVDKYSWRDTGSSFGMSDLLAAYLFGQLEQREKVLAKRQHVFERYVRLIEGRIDSYGTRLPQIPDDRVQAFHMFYLLLPSRETRDHVLNSMRGNGVHPTFHYVPLHSSRGGQRFAAYDTACPVTDEISGRLLRLPFFNDLSDEEADRVCDALFAALETSPERRLLTRTD